MTDTITIEKPRSSPANSGAGILRGIQNSDFLREETLAEIFAATVARSPKKIAMIEGDRKLSFAEVDQLSTAIARGLVANGVGPGDVVGLYFPRGIDLLVAQIGDQCRAPDRRMHGRFSHFPRKTDESNSAATWHMPLGGLVLAVQF